MKRSILCAIFLLVLITILCSCSFKGRGIEVSGAIDYIDENGNAVIDITIDSFNEAGFTPGDTVDVTFENGNGFNKVPYYTGFYVEENEPVIVALHANTQIKVGICYGQITHVAGVQEGDKVTFKMSEPGACKETEIANNLQMTNNRDDYASDEVFANFRNVTVGRIKENRLYRSSSPVNDKYGRRETADQYTEKAGVRAIINLDNDPEQIVETAQDPGFASSYYMQLFNSGRVYAKCLPIDLESKQYYTDLMSVLSSYIDQDCDIPVMIHCLMGKDRCGLLAMIIECAMGASYEEVRDDYLLTYENFYGIKPGDEQYQAIENKDFRLLFDHVMGTDDGPELSTEQIEHNSRAFMLKYGISQQQLDQLEKILCK